MNIYKNLIQYRLIQYLRYKYHPKTYSFSKKTLHSHLSFIVLYKDNPIDKNIEHIWCKSYSKNTNLHIDYHNTYLSCKNENSLRSNYQFNSIKKHNKSYVPNKFSHKYILYTISYVDLIYPSVNQYFYKVINKRYFRDLLMNYSYLQSNYLDIYRSDIIYSYQKNHNPFILYPILFGIFYDLPFYKNIELFKITIKHIYLYYSSKLLSKVNSYNFIFNPYFLLNNSNEFINLSYVLSICSTI